MQYFFIMKKITETISDKTLKASHKSSLEPELVQFLSMEHCAISKDLLTTPLTTKISATFSKIKTSNQPSHDTFRNENWTNFSISLTKTRYYSIEHRFLVKLFFLCLLILWGISWCLFSVFFLTIVDCFCTRLN